MAFQRPMNGSELGEWLGMGHPPSEANAERDRAMIDAVDRLTDLASVGKIEIRGRFYPSVLDDDRDITITELSGVALSNYRQFDAPGDILWRGRGVAWRHDRRDLPAVYADHYRDVIVKRDDLARHIDPAAPGKLKSRRGRKPGTGSYLPVDTALLEEMATLIASNDAMSPQEAAGQIAHKAAGGGTLKSKETRLAKRYRAAPRRSKI